KSQGVGAGDHMAGGAVEGHIQARRGGDPLQCQDALDPGVPFVPPDDSGGDEGGGGVPGAVEPAGPRQGAAEGGVVDVDTGGVDGGVEPGGRGLLRIEIQCHVEVVEAAHIGGEAHVADLEQQGGVVRVEAVLPLPGGAGGAFHRFRGEAGAGGQNGQQYGEGKGGGPRAGVGGGHAARQLRGGICWG